MAKNLVQDGKVLHYAVKPTDSIKSGDLVAVEDVVGVAITDGKAGELLAVSVEGVYDIPVPAASGTINQGKKVYFNPTAKEISINPADSKAVGYAWETGQPGGTVPVKIQF